MANLIVDIGNTNIKIFIFEIQNFRKFIFSNKDFFFNKELKSEFESININRCIISQVGNLVDENFLNFLKLKYNPLFFNHKCQLPIKICYKTPETLGLDRLAAVCGAVKIFPDTNVLVIDVGTAITYDLVTADKNYLGGNISPGIDLRFKSLNIHTKNLPLIEKKEKFNPEQQNKLGTNTNEAISLGVENGIFYEVSTVISNFSKQYENFKIIFTGGDAPFFKNLFDKQILYEPDLVAIGLNYVLI